MYKQKCSQQGITFVPLVVEIQGMSSIFKKTVKRLASPSHSRNYQSEGFSIAFDRLAQPFLVVTRGSAVMRVPDVYRELYAHQSKRKYFKRV